VFDQYLFFHCPLWIFPRSNTVTPMLLRVKGALISCLQSTSCALVLPLPALLAPSSSPLLSSFPSFDSTTASGFSPRSLLDNLVGESMDEAAPPPLGLCFLRFGFLLLGGPLNKAAA